jgi:hypothetical protein
MVSNIKIKELDLTSKEVEIKKEFYHKDVLNKACTHNNFYGQFVNDHIKQCVLGAFTIDELKASDDEHLNDLPLKGWDNAVFYGFNIDKFRRLAGFYSRSTKVCVLKEAARQLIKESK